MLRLLPPTPPGTKTRKKIIVVFVRLYMSSNFECRLFKVILYLLARFIQFTQI